MSSLTLAAETWYLIAKRVFVAWGASELSAELVARSLVESDLAGVTGHGLIRVSDYIGHAKQGWLHPEGTPRMVVTPCAIQSL